MRSSVTAAARTSRPGRSCAGVDALEALGDRQVDHGPRRLVGVAFQPAQAEVADLPVGAGAVADDVEHVPRLGLAAERAGVVSRQIHQGGGPFLAAVADRLERTG